MTGLVVALGLALALCLPETARASTSPQAARPISLYAFSRDSDAGFKDELLDTFRRELGKHLESVSELAYDRKGADVSVLFLGRGELTVEIGDAGEPTRYLWRGYEEAERMWALVRVRSFSKEFSVAGSGGRDLSRLAKAIADWVRDNSTTIRQGAPAPLR
jgi:hypothetical protein